MIGSNGSPSRRHPLKRLRVRTLTQAARLAMIWEQLWPRLVPPMAVLGLFLSVALFDLLPSLPFWLHIVTLALFAAVFGYCLRGLLIGSYGADGADARRRLERDSGLEHRPLSALLDQPIDEGAFSGDDQAKHLWQRHLERMAAKVAGLRVRLPSPGLPALDPFALRAALLLVMIIAGATGGSDAMARLERALVPQPDAVAATQLKLDVWITPPPYTGLAPIFLEGGGAQTVAAASVDTDGKEQPAEPANIRIPVGSTLLAQVGRMDGEAKVDISGRLLAFEPLDEADPAGGARAEGSFEIADVKATTLVITADGRKAAEWPIQVVADEKPQVEFVEPPKNLGRGLMQVSFEATDDYGLAHVGMTIRHAEGWALRGSGEATIEIGLPAPGLGTAKAKGLSTQDLSSHPWAGSSVKIQLNAKDAAEQRGESDVITLVLPARVFNHPVARALVEERRRLNNPADEIVNEVVDNLHRIAGRPRHFFDDTVVFLSLVIARGRLAHDGSDKAVASVQKLLWETALRIEDGEFSVADRDLRDAQKRLAEAMQRGAPSEELKRLMDELQRALDKYMAALAEHLARQGLTDLPQNPATRMMEGADLQRMLDQMRQLSQTGAIEAAKRMLAEINRMLDAIRNGARMARQPRGLNKGRQALKQLRSLSQRQQRLLDRNFRQMQRDRQQGNQQSGQPNADTDAMSKEQEQLRKELGRLMLQMDEILGAIPPSLGKADRAMKGAGKSLQEGDRPGSIPGQTEALKQLRRAAEGLAEQMARRMQGTMGLSLGRQGRQPQRGGRDPFGRRPNEGTDGMSADDGDVKVPTQMEMRRSREILDELRKRSGERDRPTDELDYIERLIRKF